MKKTILVILIALLAASADTMAQGFGMGIKAGLNFANQEVSQDALGSFDADAKTGYHFGVFARLMISDNFGIQPEAYYSVQNTEVSVLGASQEIKNGFIQVPVLARIEFLKFLNVHAGPQFGILLSNEIDGEDFKDSFKSGDFGIAAGVGVDLPLGISGTLRYVKGLSNFSDEDGGDIKNNMFQISVGYRLFGLGG